MKINIFLTALLLFTTVLAFGKLKIRFSSSASFTKTDTVTIVGEWVASEDTSIKLVFPNEHTCKHYDNGVLKEIDSVIVSNASPQCGITVPVTVNTTYIQFIDKSDTTRHFCYEITGLTTTSLAMRTVDLEPVILFYRP